MILVLYESQYSLLSLHNTILINIYTQQYRPEGGWEEPNELDLFTQHGFQKVTLGTRVLRSDVAVVSLLALAQEVCSKGVVRCASLKIWLDFCSSQFFFWYILGTTMLIRRPKLYCKSQDNVDGIH